MSTIAVGLGSSRGVDPGAVRDLLATVLREAGSGPGKPPPRLTALATVERRRHESGLVTVAAEYGMTLVCFTAEELDAVAVPNPSAVVRAQVGTGSVAEAAAILAAGGVGRARLIVPKRRGEHVTAAVAGRRY